MTPIQKRIAIGAGFVVLAIIGSAIYDKISDPDDYLGCLEKSMKEAKTEAAARAISSACYRKYGDQTRQASFSPVKDVINYAMEGKDAQPVSPVTKKPTKGGYFDDFPDYVPEQKK